MANSKASQAVSLPVPLASNQGALTSLQFDFNTTTATPYELIALASGIQIMVSAIFLYYYNGTGNWWLNSNGNQKFWGRAIADTTEFFNFYPNAIVGELSQNLDIETSSDGIDIKGVVWYKLYG